MEEPLLLVKIHQEIEVEHLLYKEQDGLQLLLRKEDMVAQIHIRNI